MRWSSVARDLNEHSSVQNGAHFHNAYTAGNEQILFYCYRGTTVVFLPLPRITVGIYPFTVVLPFSPLPRHYL